MIYVSYKFNLDSKYKLDNPERRKLLPPEKTLCQLGLAEADIVADIGCGIGYFTLPAARIVGSQGKVYALDIFEEMLEIVKDKTKDNHLTNVETIHVEETDYKLPDKSIDYALACLVVHEAEDPVAFFREAYRILQTEGSLVIVEWIKQDSKMGPPMSHRLDGISLETLLQQCGYENTKQIVLNDEMYAIIAKKV